MTWEVWANPTSNLIAARATEAEALVVVRQLLAADWAEDELTLIFDDPALAEEDLPAGVTGEELVRRADVVRDPVRRTT